MTALISKLERKFMICSTSAREHLPVLAQQQAHLLQLEMLISSITILEPLAAEQLLCVLSFSSKN